ncbi:cardiolipin synthase, partial [Clostridium perfringens]
TIAWLLILTLLPPIGLKQNINKPRKRKRNKLHYRINPKINDLISPILDEYTEKQYVPLM